MTRRRRTMFYRAAILFTFALRAAAGDLMAERLALGHLPWLLIFASIIIAVIAHSFLNRAGFPGGSNFQVEWSHDEQDDEQIQP